MTLAYYNENDPFCAQWLRNLISQNLIAPGHVDERDIRDVKPCDLVPYAQCHFFAGIGGWSYALRLAGISDHRKIWTGSCPCQPFSAAGKRLGFADDRHLWPHWRYLIQQRRPAAILGEQVASASQWLGLVRGDLEDLGYAVGAIPIEAASAGADHLRDRLWIVAHADGGRLGRSGFCPEQSGRTEIERTSETSFDMAHSSSTGLSFGTRDGRIQREALGACARQIAADASAACELADPDFAERWFGDQQPAGQFEKQQSDQEARDSGDVADTNYSGAERIAGTDSGEECAPAGARREYRNQHDAFGASSADSFEWVLGADGKARRVKPGIRLLVDGFPNRVGLLRGFGNAIDPRPAAAFIKAALSSI